MNLNIIPKGGNLWVGQLVLQEKEKKKKSQDSTPDSELSPPLKSRLSRVNWTVQLMIRRWHMQFPTTSLEGRQQDSLEGVLPSREICNGPTFTTTSLEGRRQDSLEGALPSRGGESHL